MNEFSYSALEIGHTEAFSVEITAERMDLFLRLSGDVNPLHQDESFAKKSGFPAKVVYGMLTSSFYSTLAGVYLPGRFCLLQDIRIEFIKPVYVGDVLTVSGKIAQKFDAFEILGIKARITNQHNRLVSRAAMKVGVLHEK
jgi:3-hydroxybutyryl-CoA dehydratase